MRTEGQVDISLSAFPGYLNVPIQRSTTVSRGLRHRQLPTHLGHGRSVFVYSVSVTLRTYRPCNLSTPHPKGPTKKKV